MKSATEALCREVAAFATESLLEEVYTTPKPGLVDTANTGSHQDMDLKTFEVSARALEPFWEAFAELGQTTANEQPEITFLRLREVGKKAERRMFEATGGVNTHKGAIFLLGTVCGAIGRTGTRNADVILCECTRMSKRVLSAEISEIIDRKQSGHTAGEVLLKQYGISGARGELAAGLPGVKLAMDVFKKGIARGLCRNDAGAVALLYLIARGTDTNMIVRGGKETAKRAVELVRKVIRTDCFPKQETLWELDDRFIAANLSPGGCADLLAVTYFLYNWQNNDMETEETTWASSYIPFSAMR